MQPIKGVFFDLGGTLFSYSRGPGSSGLRHVIESLELGATSERIREAWQIASKQVGERLGAQPYFLHKDLFRDTLVTFLQSFDKDAPAALLDEFHQRQLDGLVEHLPLREDCHSTLNALKAQGIYLSIVSNIDDDYLDPLVEKHGLDDLLDHWTSSEEARSCKPDPAIYHYALKKSGLKLEDVLFVGDSLHHDVAGAAAVGMRSARIVDDTIATPLTHGLSVTADPTFEIRALSELIPIVEQHNA